MDINDAASAVKGHVIHLLQQYQLSACWSILEKTLPLELFTRLKISPIPRGLLPKKRIRTSIGKSPKVSAPVSPPLEVNTGLLPPAERKKYEANLESQRKLKDALAAKKAEAKATKDRLRELIDIQLAEKEIENRKRKLSEATPDNRKVKTPKKANSCSEETCIEKSTRVLSSFSKRTTRQSATSVRPPVEENENEVDKHTNKAEFESPAPVRKGRKKILSKETVSSSESERGSRSGSVSSNLGNLKLASPKPTTSKNASICDIDNITD